MKKLLTLILALALILSLAMPALAAESTSHDVTAKYEKNVVDGGEVRNFDLTWGDLTFTYSETTKKSWNPATHTYDEVTTGDWDKTESVITVTNHSNVDLDVSMAVVPVTGTGVEVTLVDGSGTLPAAAEGDVENAPSIAGTLKISGEPNDTVTAEGIKVASITVTIQ